MLREIFQRSKQLEIFLFSPRISYFHHYGHSGSYPTGLPCQNGSFAVFAHIFLKFFRRSRVTFWGLAGHFWPAGHRLGATVLYTCDNFAPLAPSSYHACTCTKLVSRMHLHQARITHALAPSSYHACTCTKLVSRMHVHCRICNWSCDIVTITYDLRFRVLIYLGVRWSRTRVVEWQSGKSIPNLLPMLTRSSAVPGHGLQSVYNKACYVDTPLGKKITRGSIIYDRKLRKHGSIYMAACQSKRLSEYRVTAVEPADEPTSRYGCGEWAHARADPGWLSLISCSSQQLNSCAKSLSIHTDRMLTLIKSE